MSKAKRPGRTLERRRKREQAKAQGSPRGQSAAVAPATQGDADLGPSTLDQAATPEHELPWYARPPRKRLGALVAVAVLLAAWLCYLFWLAMVSLPQRS